ncbi:11824_t:CDS:2 [Ambispora gerdemannii]|uniref:11824_t:CDS:1 n=1 Tax=Ambispora gerdemannii TaxID=144530 RepID=A0A9N8YUQ1_9GLOM|nr:11824_t:CDS:2 [Ambispora gerdemannii]
MAEREHKDNKVSAPEDESSHKEKEIKKNPAITSQKTSMGIDPAADSTAVIQKVKEISEMHEEATTAKNKSDIKKPAHGRGRQKKANGTGATTSTNIAINDADQPEQAKEIITVRRPGRPKKINGAEMNSQTSESKIPTNEVDQPPKQKTKRGRPKKKIDTSPEPVPNFSNGKQKEREVPSEVTKEVKKSEDGRGKRRKFNEIEKETSQDHIPEHKEVVIGLNQQDLDIRIPDALKLKLVDDWEYVTRLNNYIKTPSSVTINQILDKWMTHQRFEDCSIHSTSNIGEDMITASKDDNNDAERTASKYHVNGNIETVCNAQTDEVVENNQNLLSADDAMPLLENNDIYHRVVAGLKSNFECAVNYDLLYNVEKPYLVDLKENYSGIELCDVYGAEHLLRLIVKLPCYLAYSDIDRESARELKVRCDQIMTFLIKNVDEFFLPPPSSLTTAVTSSPAKKQRNSMNNNKEGVECANCSTTTTAVWRAGPTQDQILCNACGLYYSKNKQHRPERLWKH